jgi:hypothetical protein
MAFPVSVGKIHVVKPGEIKDSELFALLRLRFSASTKLMMSVWSGKELILHGVGDVAGHTQPRGFHPSPML